MKTIEHLQKAKVLCVVDTEQGYDNSTSCYRVPFGVKDTHIIHVTTIHAQNKTKTKITKQLKLCGALSISSLRVLLILILYSYCLYPIVLVLFASTKSKYFSSWKAKAT